MSILTQLKPNATEAQQECKSFYQLWLENPSWSPIYRKGGKWITANSIGGKKIPLTLQSVRRAYLGKSLSIIGKRFGKKTNYAMIDLDALGTYDDQNEGIEPVTDALEELGLVRFIPLQSSESGGKHLYYPLAESVGTWAIANAIDKKLREHGINVAPGHCEVFPNVKAFDSEYNGHRLPLQEGSFILDANLSPVSEDKHEFMQQWELCAESQAMDALDEALRQFQSVVTPNTGIDGLKFTGKGQSNKLMLAIAAHSAKDKSLSTHEKLAAVIEKTFKALPGYEEFASPQSKNDKKWPDRLARWALKDRRFSRAKSGRDWNKSIADDAVSRIHAGLEALEAEFGTDGLIGMSFYKLCQSLLSVGCFSMRTLYKYKLLILNYLNALWCRSQCTDAEPNTEQDKPKAYTQVITNLVGKPPIHKGFNDIPTSTDMPDKWAVV